MKHALVFAIAVAAAGAPQQLPTFVSRTELVRLNVVVRDLGKPVPGLTARDFMVTDSGVPQQVDRVLGTDASLQAWLVLDQSGSVRDVLAQFRAASDTFVEQLSDRDRVGLIGFRHGVKIWRPLAPPRHGGVGLSNEAAKGFTSLRDALFASLALRDPEPDQAMTLVLSDGSDTMSWITEAQLDTAIGRSDAVIYFVTPTRAKRVDYLRRLAEATAGSVIPLDGQMTLSQTFRSIVTEMKSRYVVAYYPSGVNGTGWREVRVSLRNRQAQIKTRRRYYVPAVSDGIR